MNSRDRHFDSEPIDDDAHLRGIAAAQRETIQRIKTMSAQKMSRRRLIEIYGQDVVDLALSTEN